MLAVAPVSGNRLAHEEIAPTSADQVVVSDKVQIGIVTKAAQDIIKLFLRYQSVSVGFAFDDHRKILLRLT